MSQKEFRATTEQVLDLRTRRLLQKLINDGYVDSIGGCVSTGKEVSGGQTGASRRKYPCCF
jgi:RIO kinase 1